MKIPLAIVAPARITEGTVQSCIDLHRRLILIYSKLRKNTVFCRFALSKGGA